MNQLLDTIKKVEATPEYSSFHAKDPEAFLAHVFLMEDDPSSIGEFQVGYYNPSLKLMTTFMVRDGAITVMPDLEVFQRPGSEILPLDPAIVRFDEKQMMEKASAIQKEIYPGNVIIKHIFILQNLSIGQVFNISLITRAFKVINLKFDALTGVLMKHHMDSLLTVTK